MKCPKCDCVESKVIDSRPSEDFLTIRRRRECIDCKARFTTYERTETSPVLVIKKDGTREVFDRSKIINGLIKACEKRPVSLEQIEEIAAKIESDIQSASKNEIPTFEIGELVMGYLKALDEVAYVRFASVYRHFKDINTFMEELKQIMDENEV